MTKTDPYPEDLFQWMWQQLEFDCRDLQTTSGKSLEIVDPGEWNRHEGPDFLQAHLRIDGRDWYGSVEIHKKIGEWYEHGHHLDENYNNVILHVVYDDQSLKPVETKDEFQPFTVLLKPHVTKKLHRLFEMKYKKGIACAGNVEFINQAAFEKQVERVHQEYLEYKVDELLEGYDPSLPLSRAWKNCLIKGVYHVLGISANRSQMQILAQKMVSDVELPGDVSSFIELVESQAFDPENQIPWVKNGMRPASRPENRIKQAAALHFSIAQTSFQNFFKKSPAQSWKRLLHPIDVSLLPGKSRLSLMRQIVFLPALYLLGDLVHSKLLQKQVLVTWKEPGQHIPQEIKKPFTKAGFHIKHSIQMIGLAHQYKRYCREGNCHQCEVFKKAIRS